MQDLTVSNQIGIINYWESIDKYTISFSLPNTIDAQITAIVEDSNLLPASFKKAGMKIIFSGVLVQHPKLPPPRLGGEKIYALSQLTDLKTIE